MLRQRGAKLAVLVTAKGDAKITVRYLPSDGKPDLYLVDQDGDGKPEARVTYGDRSKDECDVWEIDSNGDGVTDSIGMDYDYDGKPDVIRPN